VVLLGDMLLLRQFRYFVKLILRCTWRIQVKDITKFNREFSETALKKQAEELANKVVPTPAIPEIQEVEANLGDFSLTDNGTYLSVSHKALHDATIGVVSKNEYEKGNKEALLRSVLENKFAEYVSTHALKITGSFIAPAINPAPKEEVIVIEKKASQEKPIEPAKEITSDLPLLRSADAFRQNVETVAFRSSEKLNRFVASATNGLVDHLRSLRYDLPKVTEVDASKLIESNDSFNGHIVASVSLENSTGPKYLNLPITISASKVVYPNEKETADFVSKGFDLRAKLEETLALETLTAMAKVDAEESWKSEEVANIISEKTAEIKKEASDYTDGISSTEPGSHIKMQKHLLPGELADWEVGDCIYSDGKKWKLVSKGDGIDSNDKNAGSASLWDFVECLPEEASKETKADIPR
jgi:hypothetical protein